MAYVFTPNVLCTTPSHAIFELKAALKAQGWTVPSSSDGTTYNASGDQITSGGTGAGGMGNNNSWFRIVDPAGVRSYKFQIYSSGSTTKWPWYIAYSPAAGFVGGSPSASVTPTATDQKNIGGTNNSAAFINFFNSLDTSLYMHFCVDSAAPYTWYAMGFTQGTGAFRMFMAQDTIVPSTGSSADTDLTITQVGVSVAAAWFWPTGGLGFTVANIATVDLGGSWGYYKNGLSGEAYVNYALCPPFYGTNNLVSNLGSNPYESKDDELPLIYARIGSNASSKGVSTLHKGTGTLRADLDTLTVSTSRDRVIIKGHSLPWGGAVPLI